MNIRLSADTKELASKFGTLQRTAKQGVANAINRTAEEFQEAQRRHMRAVFTIRRPLFIHNSVKIKPFAKRTKLEATVLIDPPGGQARASILTQHEDGGTKRPRDGSRIAVPIDARRGKAGLVNKSERIKALNLHKEGGRVVGDKRTYMVRGRNGNVVIVRRTGKGKNSKTRILYALEKGVPLQRRLRFVETARRIVRARYPRNLQAGLQEAIRRAASSRGAEGAWLLQR
jgi:hypothetical protein